MMQKYLVLFFALISLSYCLPPSETLALSKMCNNLHGLCPTNYTDPTFNFCTALVDTLACYTPDDATDPVNQETVVFIYVPTQKRADGTLPTELGLLSNMRFFRIENHQLFGRIPSELGMTQITDLSLKGNSLTGPIPTELGKLNLTTLLLNNNGLQGTIPKQIFSTYNREIDFTHNFNIYGAIPSEIGLATNMNFFRISENYLTGQVPTQIGLCSELYQLGIENNQITGTMPSEMCRLTNVASFDLHSNHFYGQIPSEIGNLLHSPASYMLLSENDWTGTLPTEIGLMTGCVHISIYNAPTLGGTLPSQVGLLSNMDSLWLINTAMYGSLPSELDQLTNIMSLRLESNLFSGKLPAFPKTFSNMSYIAPRAFSFQENYISGSVPAMPQNTVYNCSANLISSVVCPGTRSCAGNQSETARDLSVTGVATTTSFDGKVTFSPAQSEDCFSDYLIYFGNQTAQTLVGRVPKRPRTNNILSMNITYGLSGEKNIFVYSSSGIPQAVGDLTSTAAVVDFIVATSNSPSPSSPPSATPSQTPSASVSPKASKSSGLSPGVIVAIVILVVGVVVAAVLIWYCCRSGNGRGKGKAANGRTKVVDDIKMHDSSL